MAGTAVVRIGADLRVQPEVGAEDLGPRLRGALTFPNPEARGPRPKRGAERTVCLLDGLDEGGALLRRGPWQLPRGALHLLRECARKAGVELRWDTQVVSRSRREVPEADLGIRLHAHQREAVGAMLERRQGTVVMPCGGGKTVTGAAALMRCGEPGLVLTHKHDLLDSWVRTLRSTGFDRVRVVSGGGGRARDLSAVRDGEVVVATIQTLGRDPGEVLQSCGAVVLDEAHHAPADTFAALLARCPARYRWGLTATPKREDGWGFVLDLIFGPQLFRVTAQELIARGLLQRPAVIPVATGWAPDPERHYGWAVQCPGCKVVRDVTWAEWREADLVCGHTIVRGAKRTKCGAKIGPDAAAQRGLIDWTVAMRELSHDEGRCDLVGDIVEAATLLGRRSLVLLGRVGAIPGQVQALRLRGVTAAGASGATGKGERGQRVKQLNAGKIDALVASQIADEGLDVPELDTLVSANPGKSAGAAAQRVGRTARLGGGRAVAFDFVDDAETFERQWERRRAAYEAEYGPECLLSRRPLRPAAAVRAMVDLPAGPWSPTSPR